jgi:hypothetical protein
MKNTLLTIFLIASTLVVSAQNNAATVIKKVNESYANQKNMLIATTYKMFTNHSTSVVFETLQGSIKKQGLKIAYKLKDIERLENASRRIAINHDDKTVFVEPNNSNRQTYVMDADLEKFLTENNVGEVLDKGTSWLLTIELETPDIERVQIEINKSSNFITKMVNFYKLPVRLNQENTSAPEEKPRMEISFQVDTNPSFTSTDFAESKFIKVVNGKVVLSDSYKDKYKIMSID